MTRSEANRFLDLVREGGVQASEDSITYALRCTGDIGPPDARRWVHRPHPATVVAMTHLNRSTRVMKEAA